jgi:hypothetical protein
VLVPTEVQVKGNGDKRGSCGVEEGRGLTVSFCVVSCGAHSTAAVAEASCLFTNDTVPNLLLSQYLIYYYCRTAVSGRGGVAGMAFWVKAPRPTRWSRSERQVIPPQSVTTPPPPSPERDLPPHTTRFLV